jgi:hypothetical protein
MDSDDLGGDAFPEGSSHPNPLFVPPDVFLRERREGQRSSFTSTV